MGRGNSPLATGLERGPQPTYVIYPYGGHQPTKEESKMATVSKADYLKRYLSGPEQPEKKKRRKKKVKGNVVAPRMRIVDDDVDLKTMGTEPSVGADVSEDEAPTVADFIDERPEDVQIMEKFKQDHLWKTVPETSSEGPSSSARKRHDSDSDDSPARNQRHDSDSDPSPARNQRHHSDSDQSPARYQRHDSDSDQSPARKQRHDSDSDNSPKRRKRHDSSDSDQSPPRKRPESKTDKTSSDKSKSRNRRDLNSPTRRKRQDYGSDQSPPRRKKNESDSDQSPPRRKPQDSDMSPPRRNRKGSDSDQSPPRKKSKDGDLSPPRRSKSAPNPNRRVQQPRKLASGRWSEIDDQGRATAMASGAKAGLSSANDMRNEATELKKREKDMFDKMGNEKLGKNAKTVFRDKKSGKRRDLDEEEAEEAEKAKKKALEDKKYEAWGKGLKQLQEQEFHVQAAIHEASKPVARFRDDVDLDAAQREVEREGDPMLGFIKRKKAKEQSKGPVKPRYRGPEPPPNRFSIWPGYRWDGVDRSNGFERKYFASLADRKTLKDEAYQWSIENM